MGGGGAQVEQPLQEISVFQESHSTTLGLKGHEVPKETHSSILSSQKTDPQLSLK